MKKLSQTFSLAVISCLAVLSACGGGAASNFHTTPPSGPVSMEAVLFPGQQDGTDAAAIQQYLMNNTQVQLGATIVLQWSAVDKDGNPNDYDWSYVDGQIQPWIQVGKKVNLVIWANSDGSADICGTPGQFGLDGVGNCAIPNYVWVALTAQNYVTCTPANAAGPQQIPNYFAPAFQTNYKTFLQQVVQHYGSNSSIGYIRMGLGRGGETVPVQDWDDTTTACGQSFVNTWGYSVSSWDTNYIGPMLQYEGSLHSPKELMVGVTSMGGTSQNADFAASVAAPLGIAIGGQGLQKNDLTNPPNSCASDWCNLFIKYPNVQHELQPYGLSCPDNSCVTGSLVEILPFAVTNKANIIELYGKDWLAAFDPSYPGYTSAYASVIESAALGQ